MQWEHPELSYTTFVAWNTTNKNGESMEWATLDGTSNNPNHYMNLDILWSAMVEDTLIWIPANKRGA
jgi:hypothetical protein